MSQRIDHKVVEGVEIGGGLIRHRIGKIDDLHDDTAGLDIKPTVGRPTDQRGTEDDHTEGIDDGGFEGGVAGSGLSGHRKSPRFVDDGLQGTHAVAKIEALIAEAQQVLGLKGNGSSVVHTGKVEDRAEGGTSRLVGRLHRGVGNAQEGAGHADIAVHP